MTHNETESVLTLALMAAFVDGSKSDAERTQIKRLAESLPESTIHTAALCQRVLLKNVSAAEAATSLQTDETRLLAYEMAVSVCEADGVQTPEEKAFLAMLRETLRLPQTAVAGIEQSVHALATEPVADLFHPRDVIHAADIDAEIDKMVLNYAILSGALELLPASIATMAIVPVQMKMVYRVGKRYGHELGRGHIKELLATAGVGLTSQVLEAHARKLVGGLFGRAGGGLLQTAGQPAVGSMISFATTWALGRLAQRYYAGGREISSIELRSLFDSFTEQAKSLHGRYAGEIQRKAGAIEEKQLLPLIRGH